VFLILRLGLKHYGATKNDDTVSEPEFDEVMP